VATFMNHVQPTHAKNPVRTGPSHDLSPRGPVAPCGSCVKGTKPGEEDTACVRNVRPAALATAHPTISLTDAVKMALAERERDSRMATGL
jgi:hypothetical protein